MLYRYIKIILLILLLALTSCEKENSPDFIGKWMGNFSYNIPNYDSDSDRSGSRIITKDSIFTEWGAAHYTRFENGYKYVLITKEKNICNIKVHVELTGTGYVYNEILHEKGTITIWNNETEFPGTIESKYKKINW